MKDNRVHSFIYAHACYYYNQGKFRQAAQVTLRKIEAFKQKPPDDRPPSMAFPNWPEIEAGIRAIAEGGVS